MMAAVDRVLQRAGLATNRLPLSDKILDVAMLEERLVNNARRDPVVHVIGRAGWLDAGRWEALNLRRERLAAEARARLVFWLDGEAIALAPRHAPDLWAWRGGVYAFLPGAPAGPSPRVGPALSAPGAFRDARQADNRSMAERSRRVVEIRAWLEGHPDAPDELKSAPLDELGRLLADLGDLDQAMAHWPEVEFPFHRRRSDARAMAITMGEDRGSVAGPRAEALRILQEEKMPAFERLGDVRTKAVTMGKIAELLKALEQTTHGPSGSLSPL